MSYLAILRGGLKIVDKQTKSFQGDVTHKPFASRGVSGPIPGTPVTRQALIDYKQEQVVTADGTMKTCRAVLTFPRQVTITVDDRFTLPDGVTSPVLSFDGFLDPQTHTAVCSVVYLG